MDGSASWEQRQAVAKWVLPSRKTLAANSRVAIVLASLLGTLIVLRALGVTPLLAWTLPVIEGAKYPLLFGAYFATWLAARNLRGTARRDALLVGSVVTAAIFDLGFLALSIVWICGLHTLLRRLRLAVTYVLTTFGIAAIACNHDLVAVDPAVARWGYLLAVSYTFRLAWLLHQVRMHREQRIDLGDLVLYFVFAPFFVIVPYMIAIPRLDRFTAGLAVHDSAVERSGLKMIGWGIVLAIATWIVREAYGPSQLALEALGHGAYGLGFVHGFFSYMLEHLLIALSIAAVLVGMVRVLGIDLGPSFDKPLRAESVTEWWRRWNTHFRDLLVELFYYPVVMRMRRQPVRAMVLGCIAVFLVGSTLLHWPNHFFMRGYSTWPVGAVVENTAMSIIVCISLVREHRRAKAGVVVRGGVLRRAARILVTLLLVYVAVVIVGRGAQRAVLGAP